MAVEPLFLGLLLLAWLFLGLAGWTAVTFLYRPRASFLALGASLVAALVGGIAPALVGWRSFAGLWTGLLLALLCSMGAAWQTMSRTSVENRTPSRDSNIARSAKGEGRYREPPLQ